MVLIEILCILGPAILLAIIVSPSLRLHERGWIFTKPRKGGSS